MRCSWPFVNRKGRPKRRLHQRGAVLVEAAIVVTLIAIILNGILDYGQLFGDDDDLAGATRSSALTGAATGATLVPDSSVVNALISRSGSERDNIARIVIYKATPTNDVVPPACLTEAESAVPSSNIACDVFTPANFSDSAAQMNSSPGAQGWPLSARKAGTDYLGVWVQATRTPIMNFVWSPSKYDDHFVVRLEPIETAPDASLMTNGFVDSSPYVAPPENLATTGCWNGRYTYNAPNINCETQYGSKPSHNVTGGSGSSH